MSISQPSKGAVFRALHYEAKAFILPNPWDRGTARILAAKGFKALATTSAGFAFSQGLKEGVLQRGMVLQHCRDMVCATDLPVSADLEKGFGDTPENVADTVRAAAETGLAGCSIEDHTGDRDNPIFGFELAVERIQAAVEAARALPEDFVLTARSENHLWGCDDLKGTIARLQAFQEAGADVLYAPGLHDLEVIRSVCAALDRPVNVVMGMPGAAFGAGQLSAAGVKRISTGSALARAAFGTFLRAAGEMAEAGTFSYAADVAGFAELEDYFSGS